MENKYKLIVHAIFFLTPAIELHAQIGSAPPAITWQKSVGGSSEDVANCIKPSPDGGFIVVGASSSNNGDISGCHGHDDACVFKLSSSGEVQWQHSYGGTGIDQAASVVALDDGSFVIAGKNSSNNGDVSGNHGSSDFWIFKVDGQGILQWTKSYGGSGSDLANSIDQTSDGGFIVSGTTYSSDGNITGYHALGDAWVIRLDQDGNLQWQKIFGGSQLDIVNDVHHTNDGGFIVTGYSLSQDGDLTFNYGQEDYWFFKLDENGTMQWQQTMGGTGGDCASMGIQTNDGGYAICGFSHSRDLQVEGTHGAHDMWIVKTNSSGEAQWARCYGGSSGDDGIDIKQQPDGILLACAYTVSNDDDVSGNHGQQDVWLIAIDTDGNLLSQKTLGGSNNEYPHSVQVVSPGQYVIAGKSNSTDGDVSTNQGANDFWVVRLSEVCIHLYYADADGDGYGDINAEITACSEPAGYVADKTDCNDNNSSIHPSGTEVCNGLDDDCNGNTDEGVTTPFYADADHDGYGNAGVIIFDCSAPSGYVSNNADCNDGNHSINPGVTEICNSLDDDCDAMIDEVCDADGDGYNLLQGDCNDANLSIHPNAAENCNGIDDNCNGVTDEGCDVDGDGYETTVDCDDHDAAIHPNASEICNGLDDNCNGVTDENVKTTFYADVDGDGYGNISSTTQACAPPANYVSDHSDCNDAQSGIHPNATEICNTVDDNCNSQIDEGVVSASITPSGNVVICVNTGITLSANTGSGLTYQWKKNGANINGATNATYLAKLEASFKVVVTTGSCSATSAETNISISALPSATINPSGTVTVCPGTSVTMNANTGYGLSYQWLRNSAGISGATSTSYITSVTGSYKVNVTNIYGCSKTSATTTLSNYDAPSVKITSTGNLNICNTGSVLLSAKVMSGYTYRWYKNNNPISGATGVTYTATQPGTYFYQATTPDGCSANSTTKVVTSCRLEDDNKNPSSLSVYPNPVSDNFTVELNLSEDINTTAQVELINLVGDVLLIEDADVTEGTLLHHVIMDDKLPNALYFVKVIVEDQVFFQRIIYQQ